MTNATPNSTPDRATNAEPRSAANLVPDPVVSPPSESATSSSSGSVPDPVANPAPDLTPAIEALRAAGVPHRVVRTVPARSPEESAGLQGIELGALLRTIVVRRGEDDYLFVLVPGGRRFDWPKLRAHVGVSRMSLPHADEAKAVTGYARGAITPFGATHRWPVIADASILGLSRVAIGGGGHGVNVHLAPADLVAALGAEVIDVTRPEVEEG